ncbi:EcsC family protein [Clostridium sp. SM-530-WT-3G]|nr:EcsC family protein [Clostridium sp. SM-530-WT-3G]
MLKKTRQEEKVILKEKQNLAKKENNFIRKKEILFIKKKLNPLKNKVEEKIPDKLAATINKTFEKGFYYIFEKGTVIIEKSYNVNEIKLEADVNQYRLSKELSSKNLKIIDKGVNQGKNISQGITAVEGSALGFIGVGMPDIPVFISVMLRMIYEISLKYGFDYDNDKEKVFILNTICFGISKPENKKKYSEACDKIAKLIDNNEESDVDLNLDNMIKETSKNLVNTLLVSKFIQGIPLVGTLGGAVNYMVLSNVSKAAQMKYKKRFINKL